MQRATARLVAALAEVDARRLWADAGCSSLYDYCTRVLRFSEQEAYLRMEAARVAQDFPVVLSMLDDGELTLTNVGLLKPHLTQENHAEVLDAARGKSKREVARQVAVLRGDGDAVSQPIASIVPISADRFRLTVDICDATYDKLQSATDLLRHTLPDGDVAEVLDRALNSLLRDLARTKYAATSAPRAARRRRQDRGTSRLRFGAPSGTAMAAAARLSGRMAGAVRRRSWSSTISRRSPSVARRLSRTSNFGAARTISVRRSCSLARRCRVS